MATADLITAFEVGRNAYVIDTLAFRGILDRDTNVFRLQVARVGSQVWLDVWTLDANALLTYPPTTVANLPAAPGVGATAVVTDLLAPTYLGAAVGGGAVTGRVLYTGAGWVTG